MLAYSHPRWWEAPLRFARFYPLRCLACDHRFFAFSRNGPDPLGGPAVSPDWEDIEATPTFTAVRPLTTMTPPRVPAPARANVPLPVDARHMPGPVPPARPLVQTSINAPAIAAPAMPASWAAASAPIISPPPEAGPPLVGIEEPGTAGPGTEGRGGAMRFTLQSFAILTAVRLAVGFTESRFLGLAAMWLNMLTLETIVGALLAFLYLRKLRLGLAASARASALLALRWVILSMLLDILVSVVLLPSLHGRRPNWAVFHDQSPWIWLCYAALPLAAGLGWVAFVFAGD